MTVSVFICNHLLLCSRSIFSDGFVIYITVYSDLFFIIGILFCCTPHSAVSYTVCTVIIGFEKLRDYPLGKCLALIYADSFSLSPETRKITLPTDIAKDGEIKIAAFYDYEAEGSKIVNKSDVFGKTLKVYVDCIGTDVCDKEYKCQFVFPRGQFSGEFAINMGGDQTVQDFKVTTLVDVCQGADSELFEFIVYKDAE